ncbi:cysteine desulfurase, partial [Streptomyces sp. UH6]|nr:cysteine desulfurase [Streptomyces sp. UH6]
MPFTTTATATATATASAACTTTAVPAPAHVSSPAEPLPVLGLDVTVPLASGHRVPYAALDQAASAPVLREDWD